VSRTLRLIFFLVGATLVTLMVWHAGPAQLWTVFRSSLWVIAALIPLWAAVYVLNAVAWRLLASAGGEPIPLPRAFLITLVTFAVNYSTPLASFGGEPLKVVAATKFLGKRRAVGSVVAFRLLHALAHVLAWLLALIPAAILLPHTPLILGAVLALLGLGTLAHVLLSGVQRRRRDLAVLKALGLRRSQLLRLVAWQASALAAAPLLAGLPLGLLVGRWAWLVFANSAGVGSAADVPAVLVLLTIPVTLILANLIAAGPGWSAARVRPARVLRAE